MKQLKELNILTPNRFSQKGTQNVWGYCSRVRQRYQQVVHPRLQIDHKRALLSLARVISNALVQDRPQGSRWFESRDWLGQGRE